jgi:hypothetical protein
MPEGIPVGRSLHPLVTVAWCANRSVDFEDLAQRESGWTWPVQAAAHKFHEPDNFIPLLIRLIHKPYAVV